MHSVIGVGGIIQVLIEIPTFDSEVFIKGPTKTCERPVLIEARLSAWARRIEYHEEFVPHYHAQTRFKLQRVHEFKHLPWTYPDFIVIAR